MISIPHRRVVQGLSITSCTLAVRENGTQVIGVRYMYCDGIYRIEPVIAQNADKLFQLKDTQSTDYSLADEITFDIWQGSISGPNLFSTSLTGGGIIVPADNIISFEIDSATSGAFPIGRQYCEAWVTISGGFRRCIGAGPFTVKDTRKFD